MHIKARMEKMSKIIKRTELERIKDKNRVCSWYGSMRWMGVISQLNLCCTFGCAKFFSHRTAIDLHRIFRWNGGKLVNCMICGSRRVWYLITIVLISIEISYFNYTFYFVIYDWTPYKLSFTIFLIADKIAFFNEQILIGKW